MNKKIIIGGGIAFITIASMTIGFRLKNISNVNIPENTTDIVAEDNEYNTYSYVTENMKQNSDKCTIYIELASEFTPENMLKDTDAVALVTIVSKDGASMKYSNYGMTYGTMIVDNILYGSLVKSDELIEYLKPGGYVSVADYDAQDIPAAVEKRDYLRKQAGIEIDKENTYYNLQIEDDVELEVGKTYLAYLHYSENINKYEIIGLRTGLREVNVSQKTRVKAQEYNINDLKIKNNKTGEWESLNEYVKLNLQDK